MSVGPMLIDRFRRLPRRADEVWQGGLVRARAWIEEPDGSVFRPWAAAWVSLTTGLVNVQLLAPHESDSRVALQALVDLGLRFAHCRPAGLEVVDDALGAAIVGALGDPALSVSVRGDLPAVHDMMRRMERDLDDDRPLPPGALDVPGVTVERMRAFAEAARDFYRAAPWQYLTDEDLIHVEAPGVAPGLQYVTVLGAASLTFGLGFVNSPGDLDDVHADLDPESFLDGDGRWSVLYGPLQDLPFSDVDLWEEHQLPVADASAYPMAVWFGPDGDLRRPGAGELADLEAILRALARTTEAEIDSGRWSHEVSGHDRSRTVTLAIPELLAPLDAPPAHRPGTPDRRAMERVMLEVERFTRGRQLESLDEINAALRERFSGPMADVPSTAETPLEQAQDLMYRASDARGRRRVLLARRALELSADCADAYVVLAEASRTTEEARALYEQGVAAGERALGPQTFEEEVGHFWGIVRTRPYMRARLGLAHCLEALDRRREALEHYRELLRLNPGDNQGARYAFLAALLLEGRDDEAAALLEEFGDEPSAVWRYGRALSVFRREGPSRTARQCLRAALRTNHHVPRILVSEGGWPGPVPGMYAPGSREEAIICDDELGEAWRATPEAIRWLRAHALRGRSKKRRKR